MATGGERSLRLSGHGVRLARENGYKFGIAGIRILQSKSGAGRWYAKSSTGGAQVLEDGETVFFSGPDWTDITTFELSPFGNAGELVVTDWRVQPNPDPVGGDTSFVDTVYKHDILDNAIEVIHEVQNGPSPHFLTTRYRYDANENLVLAIRPEGNASTRVYDERDLLFRQGSGEHAPELRVVETGVVFNPAENLTSLVTSGSFMVDQWAHHFVRIADGMGRGQFRRIAANTRNILTVSPAWSVRPDSSSTYEIGLTFALLHPSDPIDYDVRGGLSCNCASYAYDGNRNVIEMVDAADTDLSANNNSPLLGPGDRTRYIYDGFDRLVSGIDAVGNQLVHQYDPANNVVRELRFGPTGGPAPTSDEPAILSGPVSIAGVVQSGHLVNTSLLSATEYQYDELVRQFQTDRLLFVNTIPTERAPDVEDGAFDLGKHDLTQADNQPLPGVVGVSLIGRVSTRNEFDRKSRHTFTVEDDGDMFRAFYDGVDRIIKEVDPEENTIEAAYDNNSNLVELRRVEISQQPRSGDGTLQNGKSTGSNDLRTLNDTTQSWRRFEWSGRALRITAGTGNGQVRYIVDNVSDHLKVDEDWDVVPDETSRCTRPSRMTSRQRPVHWLQHCGDTKRRVRDMASRRVGGQDRRDHRRRGCQSGQKDRREQRLPALRRGHLGCNSGRDFTLCDLFESTTRDCHGAPDDNPLRPSEPARSLHRQCSVRLRTAAMTLATTSLPCRMPKGLKVERSHVALSPTGHSRSMLLTVSETSRSTAMTGSTAKPFGRNS